MAITDKTSGYYSGILTRGTKEAIDDTSVVDGKIRLSTDTQQIFFDLGGGARIEITDVIRTYTSTELTAGTTIPSNLRNKFFIASDNHHLFIHNGTQFADLSASNDLSNYVNTNNISTTGSGNAVTGISASSGAVVFEKSETFLTANSTIAYATSAGTADTATSATSAGYATSAGSADTATTATSAGYATSAGTAESATTATYIGTAGSGSTANMIPYYGNGGTTATPASTSASDCFNMDFGDIDSTDYYF